MPEGKPLDTNPGGTDILYLTSSLCAAGVAEGKLLMSQDAIVFLLLPASGTMVGERTIEGFSAELIR